jgi:ESCRT-II complex subunit VPS22
MRRKAGVGAISKKKQDQNAFSAVGKASRDQKIEHVKETLTSFQTSLAEFATKHKDKINADPEFRQQFHKMCSNIGVDPLASNKGFWADILGVGDYYYELGVAISHICLKTRSSNGGIISIVEMCNRIRDSGVRSRVRTSEEDVIRAVQKLSILGNGFKVITMGGKSMILSVPMELNNDHEHLIQLSRDYGYISEQLARDAENWSAERFYLVLTPLLRDGMVWVDDHDPSERRYMFPSTWKESKLIRTLQT